MLENANQALTLFDNLISLASKLKNVLTPQYKEASRALGIITNFIYDDIERLMKWMVELENFDFSKESTNEKFSEFKKNLQLFTYSKEYDNFRGHCHDIGRIYQKFVSGKLKKWFANDRKLLKESEDIFLNLSYADNSIGILAEYIIKEVEKSTNNINSNYEKVNDFQKQFVDKMSTFSNTLRQQRRRLESFRNDFSDLSGEFATKDLNF